MRPLFEYLLICDIDNTLTGDDEALSALIALLKERRGRLGFGVATGRSIESTREILWSMGLDRVDVYITAVGSEIQYDGGVRFDEEWRAHIDRSWERKAIVDALADIEGVRLQSHPLAQRPHKVSYTLSDGGAMAAVKRALDRSKIPYRAILSHGHYLDILPIRASKGLAIEHVAKKWGMGEGTIIDPSAVILGPTTIGRGCYIGPGVVIDNCAIGDSVNIAQGCQLMLSVVGNNCFLPFRAALFMTTLMEYTIVAQNTCLQMCVIGRNSFVGAGTTFTDFNLLPASLRALNAYDELEDTGQPVLGGCVGHNARIGSGMVVMPGRVIESDVVLFASPERRVISRNISYEESDHHKVRESIARQHKRRYPRSVESEDALLEPWE